MHFVFKTSKQEIHDLIQAWILLSLAFAILLSGGAFFSSIMITKFILAALTVGVGFLFHELAHKVMAQRYGCFAEFRASIQMLVLAIIMSFFGFLFAAPGAVIISGHVSKSQYGKIAVAGPIMNLIIVAIFGILLLVANYFSIAVLQSISSYGIWVNAFLAFFNMMPFFVLDGKKVLQWSKKIYVAVIIPTAVVLFLAAMYIEV
ncbi:MAG: hypothetical protein KJ583_00400 [Nanoarchaeota archaeon]|nr:hypothetical protein [Nanoarchaeota archaeon]MBU1269046.1 hypothetical protein [Nanoarchaeota archaeon]MBU1603749.1 hypothetical protein [Nanoarchaeota archaeon]MBU2443520.1 hypothetical protein [Nanoarchaeota archaeon]